MHRGTQILFMVFAFMLIALWAGAANDSIITQKIFSAEAIAKSGTVNSSAIDLRAQRIKGYFSIQVELTGDGTCKLEFLLSNDGVDYLTPTGSSDIVTALVKTSGPGSDGKNIYAFTPPLARYLKIKATETGGANPVALTATLTIQ